ncbi:hypothetical protein G3I34_18250 [Streptomyces sp. SID8014]|uniref:hypothetical protein n=1 Tax=Streptomyces sp. SID8014 TaxID=2706097 RepID=UPI0013BD8FAF|nr:hypothetical protein [Streptomyces sp. SID8014]NEC14173.1 hypothetical protein [Streptomyces sp. SID8014]
MSDERPPGHEPETGGVPVHPQPEDRLGSERSLVRATWVVVAVLVAWLLFGFVREPAASGAERSIVAVLACCFAVPLLVTRGWRRTLPALDRTPRRATVTGRVHFAVDPDSDSDVPAFDLIEARVDIDGVQVGTTIADIVAAESLARFAVGSVWDVYAFEDPAELNNDHRTRVILTEAHEDVVRTGYDLGTYVLHQRPGPGSDLLLRRFANDRHARKAAAS